MEDLAAWRMSVHGLWDPATVPGDVVRRFGAMQAQEFGPAKWAIGQRCEGVADPAIEELYVSGELLRTHAVRPTWHFVHRDDIGWVLSATKARVHQVNAHYYRKLGLTDEVFAMCAELLGKVLKGGNEMTRKDLAAMLARLGVEPGLQLGYVLMWAELESVIVSGSLGGKAPSYALYADRVPNGKPVGFEEALAELTRRYFISRGPATAKDFARWSSLTLGQVKQGLALVGSELHRLEAGGRVYYYGRKPARPVRQAQRIDLVQGYDEIVMSYSESKDVLGPQVTHDIDLRTYLHAILHNGTLIGHWRLVPQPLTIEVMLFPALSTPETAAMDAEVTKLGEYFDRPAGWVIKDTFS